MWYFISFVSGVVVASIIVFTICNRRTDRANSEIAVLRTKLSESRKEIERARTTIDNIKRNQSGITEEIGDNNRELHSIIERLQIIRARVQDIETELDYYYSSDSNNNT